MLDFEEEIKFAFLDEANDAVKEAEGLIIALEKDADKTTAIDDLFRVMHSFKGSSAGAGFPDLSKITHAAESLLILLKTNKMKLSSAIISTFLLCNDHLTESVAKLREDLKADVSNPKLIIMLEDLISGSGNHPKQEEYSNESESSIGQMSTTTESRESVNSVATNKLNNVSQSNEIVNANSVSDTSHESQTDNVIHASNPTHSTQVKGSDNNQPPSRASKGAVESIRVPLPKIEQLLNEIGELVILQTVMSQNRKNLQTSFLRNTVLQMEKLIRNVQANSMSLRMLSIKPLFQKLERIVRDTSTLLNKEIEFKTKGENNEIDKTMLEQISDPLVHIIRNSVDHGIESVEERKALGKPAAGKIELSAYQQGDRMVIEVTDDGKGLDPQKITASAIKKGLVPSDIKLTDAEARNLIFLPGFSTKTEVTDLSGRGVGMDVVHTNITELQGRVELNSEVGKGTTIQIYLPLTLAIIDGIVVQIADQRFVVPLSQILEYHQPREKSLSMISERSEVLLLRGESIPILRFDRLLNIQKNKIDKASSHRGATANHSLSTVIIVSTLRHGKVALMVDRVIRQQQIVIKQLSRELQGHPGIMGGAVLGDGRVAMILDVVDWAERFLQNSDSANGIMKFKQVEAG